MDKIRGWIFRILVLIGTGLLLYTWFEPWWTAYIVYLNVYAVSVFPYGMEINMGGYEYWLAGAENVMPSWFTPFMWCYLVLIIVLILLSLFPINKKKIGLGKFKLLLLQVLIGGVGLSFIAVVVAAYIVLSVNVSQFYDAPLQGTFLVSISEIEQSNVVTTITPTYWLACGVGPLFIIFALLRNIIVGKSKSEI
jgi:hypothetical protein